MLDAPEERWTKGRAIALIVPSLAGLTFVMGVGLAFRTFAPSVLTHDLARLLIIGSGAILTVILRETLERKKG